MYVSNATVASVGRRFGSQFCEASDSLVAISEEVDEVVEGVVYFLLSPFLCFVFEVCLLINAEQLFHHHFGFAGSDAMDVF